MRISLVCAFGCGLMAPSLRAQSAVPGQPVYPVTKAAPAASTPAMAPVVTGTTPVANPAPPPASNAEQSAAELETLARPIALHPDPLIALILPASVYPLEVVQAARFVKDTNQLARVDEQPWDDKVKAVAKFPELIAMMDADIAWTTQLGQAFLNQPLDLMNAIQSLRARAQANGVLKTTPQQVVTSTNAVVERTYAGQIVYVTNTVIQVAPASTNIVYVPTYNPSTVYVDDDDVYAGGSFISFGVGMAFGAAIWGDCDWYYGGCYWGHHPPPPPPLPPPYRPPPGTRPPTGGRPPGTRPPGERPPTAATLPAQRWQPDQSRLNSAGAPATAQSREARGWGGASTQPAQRPAASTGAARPAQQPSAGVGAVRPSAQPASAWQPSSAQNRAAAQANAAAAATPWAQASANRSAASGSVGTRPPASPAPSFNRAAAQPSTAFSGVSSGGGARDFSSRGATSRGGGGGRAGGGGRGR